MGSPCRSCDMAICNAHRPTRQTERRFVQSTAVADLVLLTIAEYTGFPTAFALSRAFPHSTTLEFLCSVFVARALLVRRARIHLYRFRYFTRQRIHIAKECRSLTREAALNYKRDVRDGCVVIMCTAPIRRIIPPGSCLTSMQFTSNVRLSH